MKKLTAVLLLLILFFFVLPMLILFIAAFYDGDILKTICKGAAPPSIGISQFRSLFGDEDLLWHFGNSARMTALILLAQVPLSIMGGLFLARSRMRGKRLLLLLLLFGLLLPFQSIMMPLFTMFRQTGLYNHQYGIILFYAMSPVGSLIMLTEIKSIPDDHWEAALLDSKSLWSILQVAILPQLLPGLAVLVLLCFAEAWNMVEPPLVLLSDVDLRPASLTLNDIHEVDGGYLYAGAAVYCLPVLIMYAITTRLRKPMYNKEYENDL